MQNFRRDNLPSGEFAAGARPVLPAYWKRVLLSIACVYPLILGFSMVLQPLTGGWPMALQIFVIVIMLSALLTWPVMPYATRLLRPWLHPN